MQPPTGPRGDRSSATSRIKIDITSLNAKPTTTSRRQSQSATPTSAAAQKEDKPVDPYEEERRKAQQARIEKELSRRKGSDAAVGTLTKKRSWADTGGGEDENGPTSSREKKRTKPRKISYKYEDDGDIGRGEGERESTRYR
ncbi:uncharacterized protein PV09_06201 [Verruconis gallopava]|uniref:Uncharacterized protein n=1 Tax=Verruconis gallopava TaxID=253628 RepID=A0A0D2A716_9PEZI|nr:uncharacterized protein PV09_06201 [Verruconis gallopava]KIW02380.1 hypothetical protein PV09_06201 [Verruconis gallopava]